MSAYTDNNYATDDLRENYRVNRALTHKGGGEIRGTSET